MIDRNMDVRRTFNDYEEESSIHFVKTHIQEGHLFCGQKGKRHQSPTGNADRNDPSGEKKSVSQMEITLLLAGDLLILAAPEFTEGENLILRERTTVKGDKGPENPEGSPSLERDGGVSVRRGEETLIPTGNTRIQEGDILIIAKY